MKHYLILISLISTFSVHAAFGETNTSRKFYGPYCGIYCVYAAMKMSDHNISFRDLLRSEYVTSKHGSTLADLKQSLQDNGFYAVAFKNYSVSELASSDYMAILHTKKKLNGKYDHYCLYLGSRKGRALIFSPPDLIKEISFTELSTFWNGSALILAEKPIETDILFWRTKIHAAILVGIVLLCVSIYHILSCSLQRIRLYDLTVRNRPLFRAGISFIQMVTLTGVAAVLSFFVHVFSLNGYLYQEGKAVQDIQTAYTGTFIPKVSQKTMLDLIGSDVLIIDSRYEGDYKMGHIDGAINIPASASIKEVNHILEQYPKHVSIVVYCQSSGCPYANLVSLKLIKYGYENIRILKGGYNEWKNVHLLN